MSDPTFDVEVIETRTFHYRLEAPDLEEAENEADALSDMVLRQDPTFYDLDIEVKRSRLRPDPSLPPYPLWTR